MQRNEIIIVGAASVFSTTAGFVAGYLIAKKRLTLQYEELAQTEIAQAREFFAGQYKKDEFATPEKAVEKLVGKPTKPLITKATSALSSYRGETVEVVDPEVGISAVVEDTVDRSHEGDGTVRFASEGTIIKNVFVEGEPLDPNFFDEDAERDLRRNGVPYVVTMDEYEANEDRLELSTLTYFVYGNTLIDEDEAIIDDIDGTIGNANLQRFGHGSGDPMTVYIFNEQRGCGFEVLKSEGSYEEEVLGLTPENLEHSFRTPRRRQRGSYDE